MVPSDTPTYGKKERESSGIQTCPALALLHEITYLLILRPLFLGKRNRLKIQRK